MVGVSRAGASGWCKTWCRSNGGWCTTTAQGRQQWYKTWFGANGGWCKTWWKRRAKPVLSRRWSVLLLTHGPRCRCARKPNDPHRGDPLRDEAVVGVCIEKSIQRGARQTQRYPRWGLPFMNCKDTVGISLMTLIRRNNLGRGPGPVSDHPSNSSCSEIRREPPLCDSIG